VIYTLKMPNFFLRN